MDPSIESQQAIEISLLRQWASYMAMPIWISGTQGELLYYNEAAEALLGLRFEEGQKLPIEELHVLFKTATVEGEWIAPEDLPMAIAHRERRPAHRRVQIERLDGAVRVLDVTVFPLKAQGGTYLGVVVVFWEVVGKDKSSPYGTAIILFADIVESTALTEAIGDSSFRDKARELDERLRKIIRQLKGTPVDGKLLGDGVLAVFSSAKNAIEAALRFGEAGEAVGLQLHLGIHAGDVIREDGNVFGGAVNIAARISGESEAGEVLVSETVRGLARTSARVSFEDRGERELKGVGEPMRLYAVREAGE